MMRNKLYLLLAILSIFVICLASADEKPRKSDNVKSSKKKKVIEETPVLGVSLTDEFERDDYDDEIDDSYSPKSSFAHNRFLSYDPSETNYRTRSRWPSTSATGFSPSLPTLPFTVGEFPDDDEWATSGYESTFSSPFSPASYNTQRMSPSGPTCSSLIDPQYPIFSDTCGAVPQARYSLPNAFGHRDKWQIAQLLNVLASTETDPTCTRSTRLLLCPILFPSCPSRQQPAPVLPCQSYCRAVKARCASPLLENLPCEILPHSSDLCPTNQGYGPLAPPRNFPLNMQSPLSMTGGHPNPRQLSTLQSLLSSPAFQAALSGQGYPTAMNPQALQTTFGAQTLSSPFQPQNLQQNVMPTPAVPVTAPTPVATPSPPLAMPALSHQNLFNNMQFPIDTISAMLGEFPSHSYVNEHRPVPRYGLGTRASNEIRPTNDLRGSSNARSSGSSQSMVRA